MLLSLQQQANAANGFSTYSECIKMTSEPMPGGNNIVELSFNNNCNKAIALYYVSTSAGGHCRTMQSTDRWYHQGLDSSSLDSGAGRQSCSAGDVFWVACKSGDSKCMQCAEAWASRAANEMNQGGFESGIEYILGDTAFSELSACRGGTASSEM